MRTTDLFKHNRSAKKLNESFEKTFGKSIDLQSMDLPRLEDARNKLRTQIHDARSQSGFNETIENEALTKAQWMLDAINAEIMEREEFISDPHQASVYEAYMFGGVDWNEDDVLTLTDSNGDKYYVKDSPEGPLLMGEDIDGEWFSDQDGGEMSGWIGFVINLANDELVDFKSSSNTNYGDEDPDEYAYEYPKEVADDIRQAYGSTFEEIKAEAEGGMETDQDNEPQGSYDGSDDAEALASAGFGSDEDYGYHGEGFDSDAKTGDTFKTKTGTATKTDTGVVHRKQFTAKGKKDPGEKDDREEYTTTSRVGDNAKYHPPKRSHIKNSDEEYGESAPPTAKGERMVKHIKKGYAKDGKLTDKEKSIAYATAWKQHNKEKNESVNTGDNMTKLHEGEIQQASAIVNAKTMVDRVGRWIEELSGMENDTLLQLGDSIRDEMSQDLAKQFISAVAPAIQSALENLKTTRETLATGVRMLTGEEQGAEMLGAEPTGDIGDEFGGEAEPDMMNTGGDEFGGFEEPAGDEFGASDAAAGGLGDTGRAQRESIDRSNQLLRVLAG